MASLRRSPISRASERTALRLRLASLLLVACGIAVAVGYWLYSARATRLNYRLWAASPDFVTREAMDLYNRGLAPAWVTVSPWPGLVAGGVLVALGVLPLCVRRSGD
jgi:hypothetical protein